MKILITHRYYWPDKSSCSNIVHNIATHLSKTHQVDVLASKPSYIFDKSSIKTASFEIVKNINVRRLRLSNETYSPIRRILNAIYLGIWILIKCMIKKYDVIIVTTIPPVLNGFFSTIAAKLTKSKLIYYCMDVNPEIGNKVSKDFKNYKLFKLLSKIDDWTCKNANLVLVHSQDMLKTLRKRNHGKKYNIEIMNNFSSQINKNYKNKKIFSLIKSKKKLKIIFTGNIGRFQGLETIIDAMGLIANRKDIELLIVGEGTKKKKLIEKAKSKKMNVKFIDHQPIETVKYMIKNSDIGLVSLVPKIYKYSYPSKIATYLEQGIPIICVVEKESEIAKRMNSLSYGFNTQFGDKYSLANLFIELANNKQWKKKMSLNALKAFNKYYSSNVILKRWSKVVNDLSLVK